MADPIAPEFLPPTELWTDSSADSSHGSRETDRKIAHFRIPIPGQSGIIIESGIGSPVSPCFGGFPIPDSRFPIADWPGSGSGNGPSPDLPGPGIGVPEAACLGFPGLVGLARSRPPLGFAKTRRPGLTPGRSLRWLRCSMPHHPGTPCAQLGSGIRRRGPSSFSLVIPPNQHQADSSIDAPASAWRWAPFRTTLHGPSHNSCPFPSL